MTSIPLNFPDVKSALKHLLQNRGVPSRQISKLLLNEAIQCFINSSLHGLPCSTIKTICESIIFAECYDINKRRKLLHTCIPAASEDFPYEVFPLAISSVDTEKPGSLSVGILQWILGLLQYKLVDKENINLKICYSSIFIMIEIPQLCQWACQIIYILTTTCEIVPYRISTLLELENKVWATNGVSHVLRIYHTYRPDLVVLRSRRLKKFANLPGQFKQGLLAVHEKREQSNVDMKEDEFWMDVSTVRKTNYYAESTCIPYPDFTVYVSEIEERKTTTIPVLQYRSVGQMARDLNNWKKWQWPNNTASLLIKPSVFMLFRPDDVEMKVSLYNWLEVALRTEVINEREAIDQRRPIELLKALKALLKSSPEPVSILYYFLTDFFATWDYYSYMHLILDIVQYIPFYSISYFLEDIFKPICKILSTCSVSLWREVVNCLSNLIANWAMQSKRHKNKRVGMVRTHSFDELTQELDQYPLSGVLEICFQLNRLFLVSIHRLGSSLILLITIINFYVKINECFKFFELPLFIFPPPEFVFIALASGHSILLDRLAALFTKVQDLASSVRSIPTLSNLDKKIKEKCNSRASSINQSVMIFLDALTTDMAFNDRWIELLQPFFSKRVLRQMVSFPGVSDFLCMTRSLEYVSARKEVNEVEISYENDQELRLLIQKISRALSNRGLNGIYECRAAYCI